MIIGRDVVPHPILFWLHLCWFYVAWKHLPFGTVLTSSAANLSTHLHIMFGVAITPPTSVEPEAGLRGQPVQSATNKS
jgi:hypothetical protein